MNDVRRPAANTATKTTRPTPIMSAAAVRAVRAALRMALSRASEPLARQASGAPTMRARSGTAKRAVMATAKKISTAPPAMPSRRWLAVPEPVTPLTIRAAPASAKRPARMGD